MPDYFKMAKEGTLPPDFDQWELRISTGWTVAHSAALHGHLPKDFNRWELADNAGQTEANVAALLGYLP